MRAHKYKVGVLAEMEPIGNTDSHSKTLGRNWNKGEVIEVRLRTDAYDGYRDYKTVRKTIAHELAHMEFSDHDSNFWELCGRLEKEIERSDWRSGGRALSDQVFYEPPAREEAPVDTGAAWTGGVQKLGGNKATEPVQPEGRREMMARAAEARMKRLAAGK